MGFGLGRYLFFFIVMLVLLIGYIVGTTAEHEYVHQLIFKNYGINSTVKYYFWESFVDAIKPANLLKFDVMDSQPAGVTYPDQNSTGVCNETCEALHSELEIADHSANGISMMILIVFVLYFLYDMFKVDVKEEFKNAIKEDRKEQELKLLKDEYQRLTGNVWDPYGEENASDKTPNADEQDNNPISTDALDSNRDN